MKIFYLPKKRDACWYFRVLMPMSHLNINGHECRDELLEQAITYCPHCKKQFLVEVQYDEPLDYYKCHLCGNIIQEGFHAWQKTISDNIEWADVVVFQRATDKAHVELMKKVQSIGKKVGLEFDDNYFDVPQDNPGKSYYEQRRDIVEALCRTADFITVTTDSLKERYIEFNQSIYVLPNQLDLELFDLTPNAEGFRVYEKHTVDKKIMKNGKQMIQRDFHLKPMLNSDFEKVREGKIVIGYGGSPTHEKDLELTVDACAKIVKKYPNTIMLFFGYVHTKFLHLIPDGRLFTVCLVPVNYYNNVLKALRYDIGIAPVVGNLFNAGKSNLKIIEYFANGSIPVASDFTTYNGTINKGFLAENTEWGWVSALRKAVTLTPEAKKEIIDSNRKYIEENFDMKNNWKLWVSVYERYLP